MRTQGKGVSIAKRTRTWMAMFLALSMLFGNIAPAGTMTAFAAESTDGSETGTGQTPDAGIHSSQEGTSVPSTADSNEGSSGETTSGDASSQPGTTSNDPAQTESSQDDGSGTPAGTTDGSESGTTDGTNNGEESNTSSSEDGTLPEDGANTDETTAEEAVTEETVEEEEGTGEENPVEEEEILVEEEMDWESMEAMMAGAGGTLGKIEDLDVQGKYDPTDAFGGVLPYPRGTKTDSEDVMSKGIPDTKDKTVGATKVLSDNLSDITQWDHIWFGKTNRNPSVGSGYYYDYAEKNYWLEHFRWRVLDPTQDNTALEVNGNNINYKKNQPGAGEAIFLMSEGLFSKKPENTEYETFEYSNLDTGMDSNKDSIYDYSNTNSKARKWLSFFPGRNFTAAEENAVRAITKTNETGEISNNYTPHNGKNTTVYGEGVEDYVFIRKYKADGVTPDSYARIVKVPIFKERTQRKMAANGLSNEKIFFLSAGEVLAKEYGFDSKGEDKKGDPLTSGYYTRWTGRGDWQYDFGFSYLNFNGLDGTAISPNGNTKTDIRENDAWDSRVLEWKGFRYRGDGLSVPYTYSGSISWRLRSTCTTASNAGIVQGLSTTWYTGQGGVSGVAPTNPLAYRPGMNLEHKRIAFISEGETGKNEGEELTWLDLTTETAENTKVITNYKLTIKDESDTASGYTSPRENFTVSIDAEDSDNPDEERFIKYSGAPTGDNEYISCIIKDKNNHIRWYGRIAKVGTAAEHNGAATASGEISLSVLDEVWRRGYSDKLYIFSEQHNPSRETDYVSVIDWDAPLAMDPAFCADKTKLHWVVNPDNYAAGLVSMPIILANAGDAAISISDVKECYVTPGGETRPVNASESRYEWNYNISEIGAQDRSTEGAFTVTLKGDETDYAADFGKNRKSEKRLLVITANDGQTVRIPLDYTVLREKYEIGNGDTTTTEGGKLGEIDFRSIAPDALGEGKTPPEKTFTIYNHGRQDLSVTAQLVGEDEQYFEFADGTNQATISAVGVGQTVNSHTFIIRLKENVPEKTGAFTLSIRVEPKATYSETVPEEFPDDISVEPVHNYTVDVKFRGLPAGYRYECADSVNDMQAEVSLGNYKPDEDIVPEKEITFRNTGLYPVKINVSSLSEAEGADFKIAGITVKDENGAVTNGTLTEGDTETVANTNTIQPDGELTVRLRARKTEWKATYERPFARKEMNLKVHVHDTGSTHADPPDDHYTIPVTFNMYPKAFDMDVDKAVLDFGTIKNEDLAGAQSLTVTITNSGSELLTLNDVNITGDDTNAFYFSSTPQRNLGLPSGISVSYTVKPMTGLADKTYSSTISAKVNGTEQTLCDLKLNVGQVPYEVVFTMDGDLVFNSDTETLANTRTRLDLRNNGTDNVDVVRVYLEYPDLKEGETPTDRFVVEQFAPKTLRPNETLSFVIRPLSAGMQTGETYEAYICVETDPDTAFNDTRKKRISLTVLPNQYYLQQEVPNVGATLELGSIEDPDNFSPATFNGYNETTGEIARGEIRLSNQGRQPLNILGAVPENANEKGYFKVEKYLLKVGGAWQEITPNDTNGVVLPIGEEIKILVSPTGAILAEAGQMEEDGTTPKAINDAIIIKTRQLSEDIRIPVRVAEVKRSTYLIVPNSQTVDIGAYKPEQNAPEKSVILTNSGQFPAYLPWPQLTAEDENEGKFTIGSVKVTTKDGVDTTYTAEDVPDGTRMELPVDATAEVTLQAAKANQTGRNPKEYRATLTVSPMKLADATQTTAEIPTDEPAKDPIAIAFSYRMYAPQVLLAEQSAQTVDLGQQVEPYTLEEYLNTLSGNTVSVKNNGRLTLVPDTDGWVIDSEGALAPYVESAANAKKVSYFKAVNFRVQQEGATGVTPPPLTEENKLSEENGFEPGATLFFDIVPVERNEENYEITAEDKTSKLVIPFVTVPEDEDDTEEKAEAEVTATIKVLKKQYRAESVVQDATTSDYVTEEAALDFGSVTLAGNPVQPAAQEVIIQNTGRDNITIKKVWLEDASGNAGKFVGTEEDGKYVIFAADTPLVPEGEEGNNVMRVSVRPKQPSEELNSYGDSYKVNIYAETVPVTETEKDSGRVFLGTAKFEIRRQEYHVIAVESATSEKSWSGNLDPTKAYPENAPEEQTIYLKNIGNQELTISNLQISAGGRNFEITGTEPALPATLDPKGKGTLEVKVLPRSLKAETPYTGTLTVTTNQAAADTDVRMRLAVDKMPYVLVQDPDPENTPVLQWEGLVTPDAAYESVEKTVTITNIGRKPVTISGIDLANKKGFQIMFATNGGNSLNLATAFAEGATVTLAENAGANKLTVTVATLADISTHAGEIFDDKLTVSMKGDAGEDLGRSFDLQVKVDKRDYDFSITPVGLTEGFNPDKLTGYDPGSMHAGLGIFNPEDTAPSVTFEIKNTGKNTVYVRPVTFAGETVQAEVTELNGLDYLAQYNENLEPGKTATLTIRAVPQHAEGTAVTQVTDAEVRFFASSTKGGTEKASDYTDKTVKVSFGTKAPQYAIRVMEIDSENGDVAHADFGDVPFESIDTVAATKKYIEITNIGREILYPMGEVSSSAGSASGFTYGNGEFEVRKTETGDFETYTPNNPFAPGTVLRFAVQPKENLTENLTYAEDLTLAFASDAEGTTPATELSTGGTEGNAVKAEAKARLKVLKRAYDIKANRSLLNFGMKNKGPGQRYSPLTVIVTNSGGQTLEGASLEWEDLTYINENGDEVSGVINETHFSALFGGGQETANIGSEPVAVTVVPGIDLESTPEQGTYQANLVLRQGGNKYLSIPVFFMVGKSSYEVTADNPDGIKLNNGAPVLPEAKEAEYPSAKVTLTNVGERSVKVKAGFEGPDGNSFAVTPDTLTDILFDNGGQNETTLELTIRPTSLAPGKTYEAELVVKVTDESNQNVKHHDIRIPVSMVVDKEEYAAEENAPAKIDFGNISPDVANKDDWNAADHEQSFELFNTGRENLNLSYGITGDHADMFDYEVKIGTANHNNESKPFGKETTATVIVRPKKPANGFTPNQPNVNATLKITATGADGKTCISKEVPLSYRVLRKQLAMSASVTDVQWSDSNTPPNGIDPDPGAAAPEPAAITFRNEGTSSLTITEIVLDEDAQKAFEITNANSVLLKKIDAQGSGGQNTSFNVIVRPKAELRTNAANIHKTHKGTLTVKTAEGPEAEVTVNLSAYVKRYSYATEKTDRVEFDDDKEPPVENVTSGEPGLEPGESILGETMTATLTNTGREDFVVTDVYLKGMKLDGTGTNKKVFSLSHDEINEETGLTLTKETAEGNGGELEVTIGLTDVEDAQVTSRENVTYEAILVFETVSANDPDNVRTEEIPVVCHVRQKAYRIEVSEKAVDLGIADYDYPVEDIEKNHQKTIAVTNTGRKEVTVDLSLGKKDGAALFETADATANESTTIAPGGTYTFVVKPVKATTAGDATETEEYTEYADVLSISTTGDGAGLSEDVALNFRTRKPHYMIRTDQRSIEYGTLDAKDTELTDTQRTITVTNIGNIPAAIKAEITGVEVEDTEGTVTDTATLFTFASQQEYLDVARDGTISFKLNVPAASVKKLSTGTYTAELKLTVGKATESTYDKYELTIPLSLWVLNHDDPTLEPLYVKTEPLFADLGEAYASGDTAEGTRPEKQITLENFGGLKEGASERTAADVTLSWTVVTTAGPEGYNAENNPVFQVTPAEFSGEALKLKDTRQLTVSLEPVNEEDKAKRQEKRPAGNYFGTLTVTAKDNANREQKIVVNLLAKIVPEPEGPVTTYGIATSMDEVVFADINPMDNRPDAKEVTITNTGTGVIRINGISLRNEKVFESNAVYDEYIGGSREDDVLAKITASDDPNWISEKAFVLIKESAEGINLAGAENGEGASAGGSSSFTVQPGQTWAAGEVYTAEIVIETDRENVQKVIPVVFRVKDPRKDVTVKPSSINFGEREAGVNTTPEPVRVSIYNEGNVQLVLSDVTEMNGTDVSYDYVLSNFEILPGGSENRPTTAEPVSLDPGKILVFNVVPRSDLVTDGAYVRRIEIETDGGKITVPVTYVIQPTKLQFETAPQEDVTVFASRNEGYAYSSTNDGWVEFSVKNTSNVPVKFQKVTFGKDAGTWLEAERDEVKLTLDGGRYDLDATQKPREMVVGETLKFRVRPRQGQVQGVYTEVIKVTLLDEKSEAQEIEFPVSFRVKPNGDEVLSSDKESLSWLKLVKGETWPKEETVTLGNHLGQGSSLTLEKIEVDGFAPDGEGRSALVLKRDDNTAYTSGDPINEEITDGGNSTFTIAPNNDYGFPEDKTLIGTVTVTAKDTEDVAYTAVIPVSIRMNKVSYAITADKPQLSLGDEYGEDGVPSDYTDITPRTVTFTNDSNRPVKLKLALEQTVAEGEKAAFKITSYVLNGEAVEEGKYEQISEKALEPGQTAVVTITAPDGCKESKSYDATLRVLAYKNEDAIEPTDPEVTQAAVPLFFRVGATPSDAYQLGYNMDEVLFEDIDPVEDPVGDDQIAAVNASADYPTLVTITNTGSRAVAVESIVLTDVENGITATDYFEITDVKLNGVSAPDALTGTKLQPGETVAATDENGVPYETRGSGDVISFRVHVKEGAQLHEKTTYTAKVIVTTDRGVERDGREIPVTLNVLEQRPAGIWMKDIPDQEYNGTQIKPEVEVYYGNKRLTTADYTIAYKNNTNAATSTAVNAKGASIAPTVTIKGKGNYAGQIVKTFTIKPLGISDAIIPFDDAAQMHNVDVEGQPVQINVTHVTLNATGKPITAITITPTRLVNGKTVKLAAKKDFEVRVAEAVNLTGSVGSKNWSESPLVSGKAAEIKEKGIYKIPVYGLGNYAGDVDKEGKPIPRYIYLEVVGTKKEETRTLISATAIPGFPAQTYAWGTDETHPFTDGKQFVYLPKTFDADYMDRYKVANGFVARETDTEKNKLVSLYSSYNDAKKGTVVFETDITNKKTKAALVLGKDYLLTYANNDRVGTASVTITGIGTDYYGSVTKTFKINGLAMKSAEMVSGSQNATPDGSGTINVISQPELATTGVFANRKVTGDNGREQAATYRSEYDTLKKAFWYTGEAYNILGAPDDVTDLQPTTDNGGIRLRYNTGTKKEPSYVELVKGKHYYVRYTNNVNPGTAAVELVGNEAFGYTGVLKKNFKIQGTLEQEEITVLMVGEDGVVSDWKMGLGGNGKMVQIDPGVGKKPSGPYNTVYSAYVWHRGGVKPKPEVYFGAQRNAKGELIRDKNGKVIYTEKLTEGVDYSLKWSNNAPTAVEAVNRSDMKKFRQPTLTITGLGRFKGSKRVVNFDIYADKGFDAEKKNLTRNPMDEDVTFTAEDVIWKGQPASKALKQKFYLTDRTTGVVLKQGTDYYPLTDAKAPADKLIKFYYTEDTVVERYQLNAKGAADTKAEKILVEVPARTEVCMNAKGIAYVVDTGRKNKDNKTIYRPSTENEVGSVKVNADDIIPAGTELRMVVHGKGFYEGHKVETTFRVISTNAKDVTSVAAAAPTRVVSDIAKMTVKIPDMQWTGKAVKPDVKQIVVTAKVTRKVGKKRVTTTEILKPGEDFEIVPGSFVNNVNKGTAKVTIRGTYGNPDRNDKMNPETGEPNDPLAYIGGMKTVTFKIVARQMNYTLKYDADAVAYEANGEVLMATGSDGVKYPVPSDAFGAVLVNYVMGVDANDIPASGTAAEKALVERAKTEGKVPWYYLGEYFRVTGTLKDTVTPYGSALQANKYTVQRKTVTEKNGKRTEKWAPFNAKKEIAIVFENWAMRGKNQDETEAPYETYADKGFFIFTSEDNPWYSGRSVFFDNDIGKLVGEWYRTLVYGDSITLQARWEVAKPK